MQCFARVSLLGGWVMLSDSGDLLRLYRLDTVLWFQLCLTPAISIGE